MERNKIIIIGSGKMAYSIAQEIVCQGHHIIGFTDVTVPLVHDSGFQHYYLGTDEKILSYSPDSHLLIFALSDSAFKEKPILFLKYKELGYTFFTLIFRDTSIADNVEIGEGAIIFKHVNINSFSKIGKCTVINSNTSIDHDNKIGENVYIGPGVTTGGSVEIGDNVLVGIGATILPQRKIFNDAVLGAGSLLTKDIPKNQLWYGNPAIRRK